MKPMIAGQAAIAAVAALLMTTPALADNDTPTAQERAGVIAALKKVGCTNPTEIEREDGGFEADNAKCKDGVYDFNLSRDYKIISRERED